MDSAFKSLEDNKLAGVNASRPGFCFQTTCTISGLVCRL